MLHGKQKLFEDWSFLQLSINTFELFKKKKNWMTHLITYSEDTFLCDRELGDFISFLFFGFFFLGGGVSPILDYGGFTCIDCKEESCYKVNIIMWAS